MVAYFGKCHLVIQKDKHIHYKKQTDDSNPGLCLSSWQFHKEELQSSFAMPVGLSYVTFQR